MSTKTNERRAALPRIEHLVDEVAPRLWEMNASDRHGRVPQVWRDLVETMRQKVYEDVAKARASSEESEGSRSEEEARGYYWHFAISNVDDMLDYLMQIVRQDIGIEDDANLASMMLVSRAMLQLNIELQTGGASETRHDEEERRYRSLTALRALSPQFDDAQLRRFRAVAVAQMAVKHARMPDPDRIDEVLREAAESGDDEDELARRREWFEVELPAMDGVLTRQWLREVDERFGTLDPLVILEEFAAARSSAGGRDACGDGRTGPVRAAARLAVMCGALDFVQRNEEEFDTAVERARNLLLVTRSRIRKELKAFPGQRAPDAPENP